MVDKKEREVVIIDVAIPGDDSVKNKELEKLKKYQLLKAEIAKVWRIPFRVKTLKTAKILTSNFVIKLALFDRVKDR